MRALSFAMFVLLGACGGGRGGATLTLTPEGGESETLTFGTRDLDGVELEPFYTGSSIQMTFASTERSAVLGGAPKMFVSSYNRVLDPTVTPLYGGEDRFGVGQMEGQVLLQIESGGPVTTAATMLYIDQWRFMGATGVTVKGRLAGNHNGLEATGSFEFSPRCGHETSPGGALCGVSAPLEGFTSTLGVKRGYLYCPEVLFAPFVADGASMPVYYERYRSVRVGGAEVTFVCAETRGAAHSVLCGAERTNIEWEGCTWDVYALALPSEYEGQRQLRIWVGAVADKGCDRPITYCNTEWLDDG
jgi:hypothetical protein